MRKFLCVILALGCSVAVFGQKADLRKGNRQFKKKDYAAADISYRKAIMQDTSLVAGYYNLAGNLYRQENFDEAAKQLDAVSMSASEAPFAPDYYFNRGDVAIAKEDWQTAVNMFKECLRRTPEDLDAKENYLYARNKLQEQQQNQDQNQNHDQNQDQNQNQNQDQQQDQNQDQQQNQEQNKDQDKNQDQNQNRQQQQQPQLSPQQAQQLLQAIQDKEKKTQEKVEEKKADALKSRQKEKNW